MGSMWVPVRTSWRLNERHYGALQGLEKAAVARRHGEEQLHQWKRGYRARPPTVEPSDSRYPGHDARYAHLGKGELPLTESLEDVSKRILPYWSEAIVPTIKNGGRALVVAHSNSLRVLVKHLDGLSDEGVAGLEIPACRPLVYEIDGDLRTVGRYHLGDRVRDADV